jgi:hypothetical protein
MTEEPTNSSEMSVFNKIIGIFTSPRETFVSINQKPTWLVPFIIGVIFFVIFQYLTMDIQADYQIATMEAKQVPAERIEMAQSQMQGPLKYVGFVVGPIFMLIFWVIFAALFYLFSNWMVEGESSFKKVFSIVAWSSLVGNLGLILLTFLIVSKGTPHGVAMDLSVLMTTPPIGEEPGLLYLILSKFDLFVIWQIILWIIGLSVSYNTTTNKTAVPILILWGIWIVVSIAFKSFVGPLF